MDINEIYERGGWLIVIIGLVSVTATAFFFERLFALRESAVRPSVFMERVRTLSEKGAFDDAEKESRAGHSKIARLYEAVLRHRGAPAYALKEAAEESGKQIAAELERFCGVIGVCANIAPLLGLLGTVTGMIAVFQKVESVGISSPLSMAGGIWEALLTTAFGLSAGIVALILHRFTLSRVDRLVLQLEEDVLDFIEIVVAAEGANKEAL